MGKVASSNFWKGIKSGYPVCCIIFFCYFWLPVRRKKSMFCYNECVEYETYTDYLQCPACIVNCLESMGNSFE